MFCLKNVFAVNNIVPVRLRLLLTKITKDGKDLPKRQKLEVPTRITLIGTDDNVKITDLKDARNISQRRDLKLVKIHDADSKTRRPVYRLMTNADYHEESVAARNEKKVSNNLKKSEKSITISSKIGEHDLLICLKKIIKHLQKQHDVRIVISGGVIEDNSNQVKIYSTIENHIKDFGTIKQKVNKGQTMKLHITPAKNKSEGCDSPNSDRVSTKNAI